MCVHRSFACLVFSSLAWSVCSSCLLHSRRGALPLFPIGLPCRCLSLHVLLLAASRKKKLYLSCFPPPPLAPLLIPFAHCFSWTFVRFLLYFVVLVSLSRALSPYIVSHYSLNDNAAVPHPDPPPSPSYPFCTNDATYHSHSQPPKAENQ